MSVFVSKDLIKDYRTRTMNDIKLHRQYGIKALWFLFCNSYSQNHDFDIITKFQKQIAFQIHSFL